MRDWIQVDWDSGGRGRCYIGDLPSIVFKGRSVTLSKDGKALASTIAEKMRNNPGCKVAVIGYGESSKSAQQLSWDRVNEVIKYLVEKEGINSTGSSSDMVKPVAMKIQSI